MIAYGGVAGRLDEGEKETEMGTRSRIVYKKIREIAVEKRIENATGW
jgi:hypothetical protein